MLEMYSFFMETSVGSSEAPLPGNIHVLFYDVANDWSCLNCSSGFLKAHTSHRPLCFISVAGHPLEQELEGLHAVLGCSSSLVQRESSHTLAPGKFWKGTSFPIVHTEVSAFLTWVRHQSSPPCPSRKPLSWPQWSLSHLYDLVFHFRAGMQNIYCGLDKACKIIWFGHAKATTSRIWNSTNP